MSNSCNIITVEYENEYISSDDVEFLGITNNLGKVGV